MNKIHLYFKYFLLIIRNKSKTKQSESPTLRTKTRNKKINLDHYASISIENSDSEMENQEPKIVKENPKIFNPPIEAIYSRKFK
jgi:hypothetical protein